MKSINSLLVVSVLTAFSATALAENASNPLAAVKNTDIRLKHFDLGDADRDEAFIDGATMLNPKLKLKYELHWWNTDLSGEDESDWESASIKLIYFAKEGKLKRQGSPFRLALGFDWIVDLGDIEKGIGTDADRFAPFAGIAIAARPGFTVIPLVQHFESYSGADFSQTATRIIALQSLSNEKWFKVDLKVPYDWENEEWPADVELQFGKTFTPRFGAYIDTQAGIGNDRFYDWAVGLGFRFSY